MRKFFKEFKEFISRGNVMDLAVGVIIGGAFSAIVTALTNNILMPLINYVLLIITGGKGLNEIYTFLDKKYLVDEAGNLTDQVNLANSIYIDWGAFIAAIINFVLIALVIFIILKMLMKAKGVSANKYPNLTKEEEKKYRKEGKTKEEIAAIDAKIGKEKAEAQAKADAEAKANTTEALLKDIKEILKEKK